jgi:hypothetical protein
LGNNLNDILYVDNVEYLTQNITYYDVWKKNKKKVRKVNFLI